MKKCFVGICIILTIFVFAACSCDHEWVEATCTTARYCKKCDVVDYAAPGHNLITSCEEPATCVRCGYQEGDPLGHDFAPADYMSPATCKQCGKTEGEPLAFSYAWGFNNLDQMEYALVCAYGYNLSDPNGAYILSDGGMLKFENGYMFDWEFSVKNDTVQFKTPSDPTSYEIVNNDSITLNNGYETFTINDRKTDIDKDFVMFVREGMFGETGYVPYSLIDWTKAPVLDNPEESEYMYRLYLKS